MRNYEGLNEREKMMVKLHDVPFEVLTTQQNGWVELNQSDVSPHCFRVCLKDEIHFGRFLEITLFPEKSGGDILIYKAKGEYMNYFYFATNLKTEIFRSEINPFVSGRNRCTGIIAYEKLKVQDICDLLLNKNWKKYKVCKNIINRDFLRLFKKELTERLVSKGLVIYGDLWGTSKYWDKKYFEEMQKTY